MQSLKIASWNLTQGGARRAAAIIDVIVQQDADVVVVQELRSSSLPAILEPLKRLGWTRTQNTLSVSAANGLGVISRRKLRPVMTPVDCPDPRRWLTFEIEGVHATFANLHIPCSGKKSCKRLFWRSVLDYANARVASPLMLIGDLNTGLPNIDEPGRTFVCVPAFRELVKLGYVDLWRKFHGDAREYTWFSNYGNGFRVDHAFASPALSDRITACAYAHEPRTRGISDHSLLWVDMQG